MDGITPEKKGLNMGVTRKLAHAYKTVYSFLLVESNGLNIWATSGDTRDVHANLLVFT